MHSERSYSEMLNKIMVMARQIVNTAPAAMRQETEDVYNFMMRYGCQGYPGDKPLSFQIGKWFSENGTPVSQRDCVAVVPCFRDDVPPVSYSDESVMPGVFLRRDQVVVLYNVEQWSIAELALTMLHEFRHARQRLGSLLASLAPLDEEEKHETNTWIFVLNLLCFWGGKNWKDAVCKEWLWLREQKFPPCDQGKIQYAESGHDWPEVDQLFGLTSCSRVKRFRRALVALQANMQHWSSGDASLYPETILYSVIAHLYKND